MAYAVVNIGDKQVPMLAVASVNIYCKRVFGLDPVRLQSDGDEVSTGDRIDLFQKLGFIMAKLAECNANGGDFSPMNALNEDAYLTWLCGLDNGAYLNATGDISRLYIAQEAPTSTAKKE